MSRCVHHQVGRVVSGGRVKQVYRRNWMMNQPRERQTGPRLFTPGHLPIVNLAEAPVEFLLGPDGHRPSHVQNVPIDTWTRSWSLPRCRVGQSQVGDGPGPALTEPQRRCCRSTRPGCKRGCGDRASCAQLVARDDGCGTGGVRIERSRSGTSKQPRQQPGIPSHGSA